MSDTLVIFDFDGTLVHDDGSTEDFSLLTNLKSKGYDLAISLRNHFFHVQRELMKYKILDIFTYVMADFRPKSYQIRDIIYRFKLASTNFKTVYFVDDYSVDCRGNKFCNLNFWRTVSGCCEIFTIGVFGDRRHFTFQFL